MIASPQQILMVHHDKEEMDLVARYLGDIYQFFTARTETHLFRILEDQAIQLIIIDSRPGNTYDGGELCARLKSSPHFAHIPVILVVAGNNPAGRIGSLESGADAWVERPLSRNYLRAQIRNLLVNRARLKNYFSQPVLAHLPAMACTGENEAFLTRLSGFIADHLPDIDLHVDVLARLMNMSRPTLYRKIKCISDLTPNELINILRLKKAAELLSSDDHKIFEIAKMVGFNSRSNFGKAFLKHFSVSPREYQQMTKSS
jgi:AraC-like DNA-binding protein